MTIAKSPQFSSFAAYLLTEPSELPEGRYEYDDGELLPVMSESELNDGIANYLYFLFVSSGIWPKLVRPHSCEVEVPGKPRTRLPDLTILDEVHLPLVQRRLTITREMPPPPVLMEVVSPGNKNSENYKRDYIDKAQQYAAIGVREYWLIDPERAVVLVGRLEDSEYRFERFADGQVVVSPTFPELHFTVAQILNAGE